MVKANTREKIMKTRSRMDFLVQQRSGRINNELINRKPLPPFRHLDGVMRVGKYKGKKISDIPKSYVQYMMRNWDLTQSQIKQLREVL